MSDEARDEAIRRAVEKAVKRTPLSLFGRITPEGDTAAERFNAHLDDGTEVVFECRTTAVQQTDALRRTSGDAVEPLPDGEYRLKEGPAFRVVDGAIDFDSVFADPDGVEPFREYHAWREIVAIDNPLLSLTDPARITDMVRVIAPDGHHYYAVQREDGERFEAFVAEERKLRALDDGEYPLPGGSTFRVEAGSVHPDLLPEFKLRAHESTRLPG